MDEIAPAASSSFEGKESLSPSSLGHFLPKSSLLKEEAQRSAQEDSKLRWAQPPTKAQQPSPRNLWPWQQKQSEVAHLAHTEPRPEMAILTPALGHGQRAMKRTSQPRGFTSGRIALFKGVRRLLLRTSRPPGQRLHPSLELSLSGLDNKRPLVGELHNGWR